jgi:hypothetical protein
MNVDKVHIITVLTSRGDHATAAQAEKSLPDHIDTDRDEVLLNRFGIDPATLTDALNRQGG